MIALEIMARGYRSRLQDEISRMTDEQLIQEVKRYFKEFDAGAPAEAPR